MDTALFAGLVILALLLYVGVSAARCLIWTIIVAVTKVQAKLKTFEQLVTLVNRIIDSFRMIGVQVQVQPLFHNLRRAVYERMEPLFHNRQRAVYERMDGGTLRDLLDDDAPPSWRTRVLVLLDAARGIEHLHYQAAVIGNITSSNILLDLRPRLSGFGAAAPGVLSQTNGYADPEYHRTGVRPATDVYGLGVVMLEVLTGKQPVLARGRTLVSWALPSIENGELGDVLDRRPASEPTPRQRQALQLVADTAASCLFMDGDRRLNISQVVANLEEDYGMLS